jgi:septal ring factor EnvC (AmiA/AmiB activator)
VGSTRGASCAIGMAIAVITSLVGQGNAADLPDGSGRHHRPYHGIARIERQLRALEARVAAVEARNAQLASQVSSVEASNNQLGSQISSLTASNNQIESQISAVAASNNQLASKLAAITTGNSQLFTSVAATAQGFSLNDGPVAGFAGSDVPELDHPWVTCPAGSFVVGIQFFKWNGEERLAQIRYYCRTISP